MLTQHEVLKKLESAIKAADDAYNAYIVAYIVAADAALKRIWEPAMGEAVDDAYDAYIVAYIVAADAAYIDGKAEVWRVLQELLKEIEPRSGYRRLPIRTIEALAACRAKKAAEKEKRSMMEDNHQK